MLVPYFNESIDLDEHVGRIVKAHFEQTPFWSRYTEKTGLNPNSITSLRDLRRLPYVTDDFLRNLDPCELIPRNYRGVLVRSTSSGTTGNPKTVYWGEDIVKQMANFSAWALSIRGFPKNQYWLGTVTDNDVLKMFLNELASRFGGKFHGVEVDARTAKQIASSKNREDMIKFFSPIVDRLIEHFQNNQVGVYEDIAPLLLMTGERLNESQSLYLQAILFGGVGMTRDMLRMFKHNIYKNRKFGGWYGDYMNGASMQITEERDGDDLTYFPFVPYVVIEIRKEDNINEQVKEGERGIIVTHRIGPDLFIPNRVTGDSGVRVRSSFVDWDGVADVARLPPEIMKRLEHDLSSEFLIFYRS
ncbi:MAG: hypothetical protein QW818_00360 [Candidatus Aenigmatarchaeota archaeon]|nr:hypothetical protein [Candidatus Aenigmarchaeota archaeon]